MALLDEVRELRLEKIAKMRERGINPYPSESHKTHTSLEFLENFDALEKNAEAVTISGRLVSLREHGGSLFVDIFDGEGKLQAYLKKDVLGDALYDSFVELVDTGDILEISGSAYTTKSGMKSILTSDWRMGAKSLRPIPDEWYGLKDEDERYRRRYLDLLLDSDTRELFLKKAKFWQSIRDFLVAEGFLEVETPVLENTTGGADARPFVTHHNALDIDVYLRISAGELWQKRLMVAGYPKVFEIGRIFRNEGMSAEHLQDYTQMEFYWGYANYEKGMELVERLYKHAALETFGTLQFTIGKFEIDLGKPWERYDYTDTIKKYTSIDITKASLASIESKLKELDVLYSKEGWNLSRATDTLWKYCRKQIAGPGFLVGVPKALSPLAKSDATREGITERFQPLIAGSELGNGYSELNDPVDQAERFKEQAELREGGDEEAQMYDHDFVETLEYGMPPTCGYGMSERVFAFLANKSVREAQLFPLMRPREEGEKKTKENNTAVVVLHKGTLLPWQILNTVAHLTAELGVRGGKGLLSQDSIGTKDGKRIPLNIKHAIMLKEAMSSHELCALLVKARDEGLQVGAFTREMLETTSDKKVIEKTGAQNFDDVEFLGVLVFGPLSLVEKHTKQFALYS